MTRLMLTFLPLLCLAIAIMPDASGRVSYVRNGTFAKDLDDWKLSGDAFIFIDPHHRGNKCLKVAKIESPFALSQHIRIQSRVKSMTVSMRVLATTATPSAPVEMRFMASNDKGIAGVASWSVTRSGAWQQVTATMKNVRPGALTMAFETGSGAGELLIDDIVVR
jgi:hypothetical protein